LAHPVSERVVCLEFTLQRLVIAIRVMTPDDDWRLSLLRHSNGKMTDRFYVETLGNVAETGRFALAMGCRAH
jgi:hypothetical protein